ncbi:unnamed protein product [Moneuplotes crassus]|uniref:Uncharacterized protein n=1 Tax=Euplotes crassus TaxID=5936 RepID=A0AAD1XZD6_EUPCR|nr:unnamed protein product [Moneuplotes crassus]
MLNYFNSSIQMRPGAQRKVFNFKSLSPTPSIKKRNSKFMRITSQCQNRFPNSSNRYYQNRRCNIKSPKTRKKKLQPAASAYQDWKRELKYKAFRNNFHMDSIDGKPFEYIKNLRLTVGKNFHEKMYKRYLSPLNHQRRPQLSHKAFS